VKAHAVQGIEVVADIKFSQVPALVVQLEKTYDVTEIAIRDAIEQRGSFMLVHHDTFQKIEVTLPAYRAYSQVKQEQAHRHTLVQGSRLFRVASPEDTILLLLEHYQEGGQQTKHLWETILEILTEQGVLLDLTYLRWIHAYPCCTSDHSAAVSVSPFARKSCMRSNSRGKPLNHATRVSEATIADMRSWSLRPGASHGGLPSSVKALRTARQYPRIASASMSLRFSTARSIGRTPRRCFFSSKLRMPISFIHRLRCFTHIVEVA
jgi:hypothetical protein